MLFYNKRSKDYNYFKIFIAVFSAIVCSIIVYFLFSKLGTISSYFKKIIVILSPVIIGILFAYLLNPIVKRFEELFNKYEKIRSRKKLSRVLGILVTYLILIIIIVVFIWFFVPNLIDSLNIMLTNIPKYLENIFDWVRRVCDKYNISSKFLDTYKQDINGVIKDSVVPNIDVIINNLASGITSVIKWIINVIVSIIISVYLIYDKESFADGTDRVLKAYCSPKLYSTISDVTQYIYKVFCGFMIAKLIDSLIIGILTFILLTIFKIPYALLISFIVGVTNIIPFFGPFIGAIPCIALLLMINPTKALVFGILILIIQQFDGNILGPKLIGDKIGIKSFWVLFAILLFGGLFGFGGMILAVPLFACIYEFLGNKVKERIKEKEEYEHAFEEEEKKKKSKRNFLRKTNKKTT